VIRRAGWASCHGSHVCLLLLMQQFEQGTWCVATC
jgi:hypothetical protein